MVVWINFTWVTFRVIEVKVVLGEGLQAALVVSKCMTPTNPGWYDSICCNKKVLESNYPSFFIISLFYVQNSN